MSYHFEPTEPYRMPTHFGPATGPRRGPNGRRFSCRDTPKTTAVAVSFLSRPEQLSALLPPGFSLGAEPVVTVTASYMKEIEWLAGRGYNMLGVTMPTVFQSKAGPISGSFLLVLWENLTEPIITGREELGFSKIFADLPDPVTRNDELRCAANWDGFRFLDLSVGQLQPLSGAQIAAKASAVQSSGTLHYKYMPRTGTSGCATRRADTARGAQPCRHIDVARAGDAAVSSCALGGHAHAIYDREYAARSRRARVSRRHRRSHGGRQGSE